MTCDPLLAQEYNRGYNSAMEKQLHYIDREERRFTAAVAAMQGFCSAAKIDAKGQMLCVPEEALAKSSVEYADALLKELEK